jgi:adenosylcobinamide kinase/adenosylcobinamide-phosphate guanylyltransferase
VSNEVGSGIVPDNLLGRSFRDLLGRANQRFAAVADRAVLSVSGRLVELGPASETLRV